LKVSSHFSSFKERSERLFYLALYLASIRKLLVLILPSEGDEIGGAFFFMSVFSIGHHFCDEHFKKGGKVYPLKRENTGNYYSGSKLE